MGVVFGTLPERALSDVHLEGGRRAPKGCLQCLFSFFGPPKLPKRRGKPAVSQHIMGIGSDCLMCRLDRRRVFPREIESNTT